MKKIIFIFTVLFGTLASKGQTTQAAQAYVDSVIVNNNTQKITPAKLRTALTKVIDAIKTLATSDSSKIDSIYSKDGIINKIYFSKSGVEFEVEIPVTPVIDSTAYVSMEQIDSTHVAWCDRAGRCDTLVGITGTSPGGGSVNSVSGLNTDNTDPANPVIQISVDGVTVTGAGTPGSPLVATAGGGFGGGPMIIFSGTAPTDTTKFWADTTTNFLSSYPLRYYAQGKGWSPKDTLGGLWWDNVDKIISRGRMLTILVTGQSNIASPGYLQPDGLRYDTTSTPGFAVFDSATLTWRNAKIGSFPWQGTAGANFIHQIGKKLHQRTGRSVRMVVQWMGGAPLQKWCGKDGERADTAVCYVEMKNRMIAANFYKPDLFIWGQGEGGAGLNVTRYYNGWIKMYDSLRNQGLIDSIRTQTIVMGVADYSGQLPTGQNSDGDLRLIGMDSVKNTAYCGVRGAINDGIHWIPSAADRLSESVISLYYRMPLQDNDLAGYRHIASGSAYSGDSTKKAMEGAMFTNNLGFPFMSFKNNDIRYGYSSSTGVFAGTRIQALSNLMHIIGLDGNIAAMNNDGLNRFYYNGSGGVWGTKVYASSGGSPEIHLYNLDKDFMLKQDVGTNRVNFLYNTSSSRAVIDSGGRWGWGGVTSPTAWMHFPAGTAAYAPIKLTSGTLTSSPAAGAVEFDGTDYYITPSNTRYKLIKVGSVPSSASDTGVTGTMAIDSTFVYFCVATNTWVRAALTTW